MRKLRGKELALAEDFLEEAAKLIAEPGATTGAVLVSGNQVIGRGHNRPIKGACKFNMRTFLEHIHSINDISQTVCAEHMAILNALPGNLLHSFLYVVMDGVDDRYRPCPECCRTIVENGIKLVVKDANGVSFYPLMELSCAYSS